MCTWVYQEDFLAYRLTIFGMTLHGFRHIATFFVSHATDAKTKNKMLPSYIFHACTHTHRAFFTMYELHTRNRNMNVKIHTHTDIQMFAITWFFIEVGMAFLQKSNGAIFCFLVLLKLIV
mmetsp:Transcript_14883/g.18932  ORF Transcript_14883/g.18932 Transcript_14883/m.18932 type:complete len:120 (+) Transcript_14883:51-410(+)